MRNPFKKDIDVIQKLKEEIKQLKEDNKQLRKFLDDYDDIEARIDEQAARMNQQDLEMRALKIELGLIPDRKKRYEFDSPSDETNKLDEGGQDNDDE